MKKTILLTFSFFMISCGSLKKNKSLIASEEKVNLEINNSSGIKTNTQSFDSGSIRIENNGYNISVKPIGGQNSFFNFTSPDGQLFHGTTNAEISFEKKNEKREIITVKKIVTFTSYFSHNTYKSQKTYKVVIRYIDKYKESYPWYYILFAGFMLREILRLLWNWTKKSNWYLNLMERITKKR